MTLYVRGFGRRLIANGRRIGALIAILLMAVPAAAAIPDGGYQVAAIGDAPIEPGTAFGNRYDPLVERIQRALANAHIYKGRVDGRMNDATDAAIRAYQKAAGLPVDGKVSEDLATHMETGKRVDELLKKLDRSREVNTEAARQALLSHPATRDLITKHTDDVANPTRDFTPCATHPTVDCLLAEASESAKAIGRDELRDWALGELLVAQARAGQSKNAMATARRIKDPRLVMVALRDIAEAQAAAGRNSDALEAAAIIPDAERQAEAFAAIAVIQASYDPKQAIESLGWVADALKRIGQPLRRVALMARMATIATTAGDAKAGRTDLADAEKAARGLDSPADRQAALRSVAAAMAEMGEPDRALEIIKESKNGDDLTPVLVAAANAQADSGKPEDALRIADSIEVGRYKAVVLSRIARSQARQGDTAAALATLDRASESAAGIERPFARDYADSQIAMALTAAGRHGAKEAFAKAVTAASKITDDRLRAHSLWTIATERRRAGDAAGAEATAKAAEAATKTIKSGLSRVWMFGDIAVEHIKAGEEKQAWAAFDRGLSLATDIHNAWGRSRAMSRMAVTLIELTHPSQRRGGIAHEVP